MKKKLIPNINRSKFLFGGLASIFTSLFPLDKLFPALKYVDKIALGACITQEKEQPIWKSILKDRSDIFIFMGDNVYGDDKITGKLNKLSKAYTKQKTKIPFAKLKETNEIYAIWDDHDYGKNDGGAEYKYKKEAKNLFLDFWNISLNDPRRNRDGIYFETKKITKKGLLQIIFLDTRYFRSPLKRTDERGAPGKERYLPDNSPEKTFLGKEQWNWLSNKLD